MKDFKQYIKEGLFDPDDDVNDVTNQLHVNQWMEDELKGFMREHSETGTTWFVPKFKGTRLTGTMILKCPAKTVDDFFVYGDLVLSRIHADDFFKNISASSVKLDSCDIKNARFVEYIPQPSIGPSIALLNTKLTNCDILAENLYINEKSSLKSCAIRPNRVTNTIGIYVKINKSGADTINEIEKILGEKIDPNTPFKEFSGIDKVYDYFGLNVVDREFINCLLCVVCKDPKLIIEITKLNYVVVSENIKRRADISTKMRV